MLKEPMIQVALAILAGKNHLLVVAKDENYLDLPGNQIVSSERAVITLEQLLAKLGLEQMPRQILYLSKLPSKSTKRRIMGMVGLVQLKKPQRIDILLSSFEPTGKLRSTKHVSPFLKAVLEWLVS